MGNFVNYIRSAYPLLMVNTYEEFRAISTLTSQLSTLVDKKTGEPIYKTFVWSLHGGIQPIETNQGKLSIGASIEGTEKNPAGALSWMEKAADDCTVLFLRDFHPFVTDRFEKGRSIIAKIRDLVRQFNAQNKAMVFISPRFPIPEELEKDITPVEFKLPGKPELLSVLKGVALATGAKLPDEREIDALLDAALCMTCTEAENAFSLSLVEAKKFDEKIIRREKAIIVAKTGLLEVVESNETFESVGGLEYAKEWALLKRDSFSAEARAFGVKSPRGIFLPGIAGCGKSLLAKVLANEFTRPLFRLDMSRIKSKWVGESEQNLRRVLDTVGATAPSMLWIDEIEKVLAGGGGDQDGHEVTKGIFGMLLTWMEEKKDDVIIVATANSIANLPPELMSRFDVTFWVDLPDDVQRLEIIKIHVIKVMARARSTWGRDLKLNDLFTDAELAQVVRATEGFSGREIEAMVNDSISRAWAKRHPRLQLEDLLEASAAITPTSRIKKEEFERLRQIARSQGIRPASKTHETPPAHQGERKVNI